MKNPKEREREREREREKLFNRTKNSHIEKTQFFFNKIKELKLGKKNHTSPPKNFCLRERLTKHTSERERERKRENNK